MTAAAVDLCRAARRRGMAGAWDRIPGLGLALATGPDCVAFLQARLTSDVAALASGQGQLSAKLTGRGELVAYFSLHRLPDQGRPFPAFFLLAPQPDLDALVADLAATVIAEDVLLEDVGAQFTGCLLQGPEVDECLKSLGCPPDGEAPEYAVTLPTDGRRGLPADLMILNRSFTGDPGRLLLWGAGHPGDWLGECREAAGKAGLVWAEPDPEHDLAWRWLTAEAGWPALGRDFASGKLLLPGTGLEKQVTSATKGCYPGQ